MSKKMLRHKVFEYKQKIIILIQNIGANFFPQRLIHAKTLQETH